MAEEVEMTPVSAAEPPKVNPLAKPSGATLKLAPQIHKPGLGAPTAALKPGLKLPPKPGLATGGLKLPPKPGTPAAGLKPGLKLPTQTALKPGVKLPPKPVIRKPGATVAAAPLPKPVSAPLPKPVEADKPVEAAKPAEPAPKPMETLKSVTQKLKGVTQEIPQQAVLRKTGIIAEGSVSDVQKEAAKHKTARISLSDAMGVAPVKDEHAPMKTIRIKRPIDIPGVTAPAAAAPAAPAAPEAVPAADAAAPAPAPTLTQRKTLKISRPSGVVRPSGKFGIKRPSAAPAAAPQTAPESAPAAAADGAVSDIADIPEMPSAVAPMAPVAAAPASEGPAWLWSLSTLVQAAACLAVGALAWFLFQNTQTAYF